MIYTFLQRVELRWLDAQGNVKLSHVQTYDVTLQEGTPCRQLVRVLNGVDCRRACTGGTTRAPARCRRTLSKVSVSLCLRLASRANSAPHLDRLKLTHQLETIKQECPACLESSEEVRPSLPATETRACAVRRMRLSWRCDCGT
jgi:hypothetical protein